MSKIKTNAVGGRTRKAAKPKTTRQGGGQNSKSKPNRKKPRGQGR